MNGFQRIQNRLKKYKHSSLLVFKSPRFHNQSSQNTTFQTKGFPYSVIVRPLKENLSEALLRPFWGLLRPFLFWQNQKMIYKFKCLVVIFLFPTIVVYCTDVNNQLEDFSIVVLCALRSTVTSSNYFISWTISFSIYYKFKTYLWSIYFKIPQSVVICSVLLTVLYLIPNNLRINMVKVILQKILEN